MKTLHLIIDKCDLCPYARRVQLEFKCFLTPGFPRIPSPHKQIPEFCQLPGAQS